MNQQKIGKFLKELRKEKELTQEKLAQIVNVSNRTVSRWENGNNMPDLDILIELSDYYGIDLRELLDGERKSEEMNKETERTVLKAVEYTNLESERYTKRVHFLLIVGAILWFASQIIQHTSLVGIPVFVNASDFAEGAAMGMLICGCIVTSRYSNKLRAFKQRMMKGQ